MVSLNVWPSFSNDFFTVGEQVDDSYSFTHLPDATSIDSYGTTINASKLANNFRQLAKYASIAFNTTVAHANTPLQEKTQAIYHDVVALHSKFSSTFSEFKTKSEDSLKQLKLAFDHFLQQKQDEAQNIINAINEQSISLAKQSNDLHQEAGSERDKVSIMLQQIYESKGEQEKEQQNIQQQLDELEANKRRFEAEKQNAENAAADSQKRAEQARQDAEHEKRKKKKKCKGWKKIKCKLASAVNINLVKKHEKREKQYREEERKHLNQVQEQQEKYRQAQDKVIQATNSLSQFRQQIVFLDETINRLTLTLEGFTNLAVSMQDATIFWQDMEDRCQNLKKTVVSSDYNYLVSLQFQTQAIEVYKKWMIIHLESSTYLEQVKEIEMEPVKSSSADEARKIVKQLKDEL